MSDKASGPEIELMEQIESKIQDYFLDEDERFLRRSQEEIRAAQLASIRRIIQCTKTLEKLLFPADT